MSEKKINPEKRLRRHRKSEINLALFLFQTSYQGNHQDLNEVIFSEKIKSEKRWLALNARDAEGMPILVNCLKGSSQKEDEKEYLECIKILVSTGIPLDSKDGFGRTVIHWAVLLDKIQICQYLLQQGAPSDVLDNGKLSPMHIAISKRSEEFVQLLCDLGPVDILESADSMGRTPLCHAMFIDSTSLFLRLLTAGSDPNGTTNNEKSLISHAIEHGAHDFLNMLLKHKAKLFPNGPNQFNMIHLAASAKDSNSLKVIASYCTKVELQSKDDQGKTPLIYAVSHGLIENVNILLNVKVDASICDNDGKTVLHYTRQNTDAHCIEILLEYDSSLNKQDNSHQFPIHLAIMANNKLAVRALLDHGTDINVVDSDGRTLIHYATSYCFLACLAELISIGMSVNIPDNYGAYPIHYAVIPSPETEEVDISKAKINYLKKFVQTEVKLDVVDQRGQQPLHWAICLGNVEALKVLLIEGVNVNTLTKDHLNVLHIACNSLQLECLELLLWQPNIILDQVDRKGRSPLMYACLLPNQKYTEMLLDAGANPDHQAKNGITPAHSAAANTTVDCLWLLSLRRANLDQKDNNGETPLHVACINPDDSFIRFLLTRKCDVNSRKKNGMTALHIAVTSKNVQRTNILLQNAANCNILSHGEEDYTPLDIALENGDYKCIKLLQGFGARTGHSIVNHAAFSIQHLWKRYCKKIKGDSVQFSNNSSLCNSSNASESVSVRESKKPFNGEQDNLIIEEPTKHTDKEWNFMKNELDSHVSNVPSKQSTKHSVDVSATTANWDREKTDKEFSERLAKGNREIELMRQLMKQTEQMLVQAKQVTEDADSLINSEAFHEIKKSNKEYMERKQQQRVGKAHFTYAG